MLKRLARPVSLPPHEDVVGLSFFFEADATREEGAPVVREASELEDSRVLEKEVAFFGEEEVEAGEVQLPLVDLGFGEVRVGRERSGDRRHEFVEDVETRVELRGAPILDGVVDVAQRSPGLQIEAPALADAAHALQGPRVPQVEEGLLRVGIGPARAFIAAADDAQDVHAPGITIRGK